MTKAQLRDLIKDYLAGGNAPPEVRGRYHPVVIERYIEMAYNAVLNGMFEGKVPDFSILDGYSLPYIVDVAYDSAREKYYSVLPVTVMQLPGNNGIRHIGYTKDETTGFAMIENTSMPIFSELEVSKVDDIIGYYLEGTKIFYQWFDSSITQVLMRLIPPFSAFADTDNLPIPAGRDMLIFENIIKILRSKPPQDDINDNKVNQV